MGDMTLNEIRQDLVDGLQRGPSQDNVGQVRLTRWINNSIYEFGYAFKFRQLEAFATQGLLANTGVVAFPTNFRMMNENGIEIIGVAGFEGKILPETRDQYIKKNRTTVDTIVPGRPKHFHIYGPLFLVRPVADVDYTLGVHYWLNIDPLVNDDDLSIFPKDWDDIILTGALYRGFRHFNEFDRYQNVRNDFLGLVRSRKFEEDLEPFPEGGVSGVSYRDTEGSELYGPRDDGEFDTPDRRR